MKKIIVANEEKEIKETTQFDKDQKDADKKCGIFIDLDEDAKQS